MVHQELLDGNAPPARRGVEAAAGECARERLDPEMREEWVARRVADVPEHSAEAPRIAEAYRDVADAEVEVIVGSWRLGRRNDPEDARPADRQGAGSLPAVGGTIRKLPDMPRCRIRVPFPQSNRRYFARRATARIRLPRRIAPRLRGTGHLRPRWRTTTPVIVRRRRCGSSPRRVISTSGSSGMNGSSR